MEWLLCICCILLWMIYSSLRDCVNSLKILNSTAVENQAAAVRVFERLEYSLTDLINKVEAIENTSDAYYSENIKPRRGY